MEWIFVAALIGIGIWIVRDTLKERAIDEIFATAMDDSLEDVLDWYDWAEYSTCEICDDFIIEDEAIVGLLDDEGELMMFCEYCLNPDLGE